MSTLVLCLPILAVISNYMTKKNHLLSNLILIEFMALIVITFTVTELFSMSTENHIVLLFLVLMMVESVLGLSMMVNMIRTHGNDFLKSSSILKL